MIGKITASDKVILALIGAGGRGTGVILSIKKNTPNVEVKYVCEVDDSRGGRAIDELSKMQGYKPQRVADMKQVFDDKDVDAVVICTPEHWHALATIRACQAGKDVYVEKNISLSIGEGRKMIEAVNELPYNLLCRAIEYDTIPYCTEKGIGIIGYMALLQGILADIFNIHLGWHLNTEPLECFFSDPFIERCFPRRRP